MSERDYEYYLVPSSMDPHTNECIARELASLGQADGNDITFVDNKNIERRGWRVPHAFLMAFCKAAAIDKRLKVIPFEKEGGGKPRVFKLPAIKRKNANLKKIEADLAEIKSKKS